MNAIARAQPIDPRYKPLFKCFCGRPAEYRLPIKVTTHYLSHSNTALYLCPACLIKERRQEQGYRS